MTQTAFKNTVQTIDEDTEAKRKVAHARDQLSRDSSEKYRKHVEQVNRTSDSEIRKTLRN